MVKWPATRKHVGSQSDKGMLCKEGYHINPVQKSEEVVVGVLAR